MASSTTITPTLDSMLLSNEILYNVLLHVPARDFIDTYNNMIAALGDRMAPNSHTFRLVLKKHSDLVQEAIVKHYDFDPVMNPHANVSCIQVYDEEGNLTKRHVCTMDILHSQCEHFERATQQQLHCLFKIYHYGDEEEHLRAISHLAKGYFSDTFHIQVLYARAHRATV